MRSTLRKLGLLLTAGLLVALLPACGEAKEMQDGYYTAEMAEYSHGWKEFITIMVRNGEIVSAEYNAKNPSGFIKSWDSAYMQNMLRIHGTYPNEYTRSYAGQLLEDQNASSIDAISGATTSYSTFCQLAQAVIAQACQGNSQIAIVSTGK